MENANRSSEFHSASRYDLYLEVFSGSCECSRTYNSQNMIGSQAGVKTSVQRGSIPRSCLSAKYEATARKWLA